MVCSKYNKLELNIAGLVFENRELRKELEGEKNRSELEKKSILRYQEVLLLSLTPN